MHFLLVIGVKGAVVSKEKVSENSLLHLRGGLHSPRVEQLPIRSELDVDARLALSKGVSQQSLEHLAEQCRGQVTALFDSFGHREGFRGFPILEDSGHHAVVELADYCNECAWTAEFSHDFPKSILADSVESLGQVNKGRVEVAVLFHTFFLKLTGSKYVGGSLACAEAALTLSLSHSS